MDPETWTIDPKDIERKITGKTKVIVCVHLLGMPCDMPAIMEIAKKHNIKVVEDCAQALDARINGQHVGTFGDFRLLQLPWRKDHDHIGRRRHADRQVRRRRKARPRIRHNGCCGFNYERERYWVPAMSNVDMDIQNFWPNNFCIGEAAVRAGQRGAQEPEVQTPT